MNGKSMSEKLGLGPERRELKFGSSFLNGRNTTFHTVKYDFKPASVDVTKQATVDVASNHQITVTVPHLDGAGTAQTVFKGSERPCQKECVLIIDKLTGEITLEKLSTCIQLKKTRQQSAKQLPQSSNSSNWSSGNHVAAAASSAGGSKKSHLEPPPAAAPPSAPGHRRQRHGGGAGGGGGGSTGKLPKNLSAPIPRHSPLHASPSYSHSHKSPQSASTAGLSPSAIPGGSLPLISLDDISESHTSAPPNTECIAMDVSHSPINSASPFRPGNEEENRCAVDILTDSSSDSSSDDSSISDSDSESNHSNNESAKFKSHNMNGHVNGVSSPSLQSLQMPDNFLNEDLQLSESGSESD
ncbi:ELL-associated factor 2 [Nilaparvata lugens]|uniref:ELL-associated factor 2 n=1 Tax=Nilaparvata lugens TaxID=108931 RepID=UPI00193D6DB5|nr:ELL-associated factor 2 [Nilaparvata lugens]